MKALLLPEPDRTYGSAPWGWVVGLVLLELLIGVAGGVVVSLLNLKSANWVGLLAAMTASMTFAMLAEQRQPGVLTPGIIRQLALRSSIGITVLSGLYFVFLFYYDPALSTLVRPIIMACIGLVAFFIAWAVHYFGLKQGKKYAAKSQKPQI